MTKGKGQDILYGDFAFNFNKLDENGLLLNMKPYLDQDDTISEEDWISSIYLLMSKDDEATMEIREFPEEGIS